MARRPGAPLTIDCDTCPVQNVGCGDCMVTAMLSPDLIEEALRGSAADGRPRGTWDPTPQQPELGQDVALDRREREVVTRLVASGLVTAETATRARARREPWSQHREFGRYAG